MIHKTRGGVIYGSTGKVLILDPSAERSLFDNKTTITLPSDQTAEGDIALWGTNNLQPQEMIKDIENTGVLSAAVEIKARIALGKGPMLAKIVNIDSSGQEELEFVNDPMIRDWMDASNFFVDSFALAKDLLGTGNPFDQLVLSKDRKSIAGFRRMDPTECRFSKMSKTTRRSDYVYLSSDWEEFSNAEKAITDEHMAKIPLLDKSMPLMDLQQRNDGSFLYMLSAQYPLFGRKYYALPLWSPAREWVKMTQGIPALKKAMVKNQMNINYLVKIHPQFWVNYDPRYKAASPQDKLKIQEEFYSKIEESLVGGENAYKSLFATMIPAQDGKPAEPAIEITTIDDKLKEGKLLVDSMAGNSEILFACLVNPALIGADMPGGPYSGGAGSGSNIRETYLVQVLTGEIERQLISRRFNLAKQYNGWNPEYVLRFPNQLLTTLNTGGKTSPVA
jgi:hypothetical protein